MKQANCGNRYGGYNIAIRRSDCKQFRVAYDIGYGKELPLTDYILITPTSSGNQIYFNDNGILLERWSALPRILRDYARPELNVSTILEFLKYAIDETGRLCGDMNGDVVCSNVDDSLVKIARDYLDIFTEQNTGYVKDT